MFGLFKTKIHKCPDGTTRTVYRNVNDAFPFFLPGIKAKAGANMKVPMTGSGGLNAEYEQKAHGLLVKLDDWNNSLMMNFRAAYVVFQSSPCTTLDYLQREVSEIMRKHELIQRIRIQIDGLLVLAKNHAGKNPSDDSKRELFLMYRGILEQMAPQAARESAAIEVQAARKEAQKWIDNTHAS